MNRRGFLGALAAIATAPKAVKLVPPPRAVGELEAALIAAMEQLANVVPQPDVIIMHPAAFAGIAGWLPEPDDEPRFFGGVELRTDPFCPRDTMYEMWHVPEVDAA